MTFVLSQVKGALVGSNPCLDSRFVKDLWKKDAIVCSVLDRIKTRANLGMLKYGVTMQRDDVSTVEWLRHAQEEAMDLAIYLERVIFDMEQKRGSSG